MTQKTGESKDTPKVISEDWLIPIIKALHECTDEYPYAKYMGGVFPKEKLEWMKDVLLGEK